MKKLITLLLSSFLIIQVSGQTDTTKQLRWDGTTKIQLPFTDTTEWLTAGGGNDEPIYDTIPVMILYIDTTTQQKIIKWDHITYITYDTTYYKNNQAYWINGYEVREKQCCVEGNHSDLAYSMPVDYYTHKKYLDDKKKPLSKNIIVWMSK